MPPEASAAVEWGDQPGSQPVGPTEVTSPAAGSEREGAAVEPPLDITFELLKNYRRRVVLRYLDSHPSTTLSTLAEHVAAQENEKSVHELSSAERKRVYISLYQCHLPKLDDAEVVDFDSNRGTVQRNPTADHFAPYLEKVSRPRRPGSERAWHLYYLGLALAGTGLLALQLLAVPMATATTAVAGAIVVSFTAIALVHARNRSRPDN